MSARCEVITREKAFTVGRARALDGGRRTCPFQREREERSMVALWESLVFLTMLVYMYILL